MFTRSVSIEAMSSSEVISISVAIFLIFLEVALPGLDEELHDRGGWHSAGIDDLDEPRKS